MTTAVNINGIEAYLPETVERVLETVRKRGRKHQFLLYIENGRLWIAQEQSPRFAKRQEAGDHIGTYTPDIEPEMLMEDIMASVQEMRIGQ